MLKTVVKIFNKNFQKETKMEKNKFLEKAIEIGNLVEEKNVAYGDSFKQSQEIIKVLFPNGVKIAQYQDFLAIIRMLDKLFRIATDRDALGENPWNDIAGYAILSSVYSDE